MVSFSLIKVLYVIGMIIITFSSLKSIGKGLDANYGGTIMVLTGLGWLVLGNLVWRIMCELWIVLFSIHDTLGSIHKKMGNSVLVGQSSQTTHDSSVPGTGKSISHAGGTSSSQTSAEELSDQKDYICEACGVEVELEDREIEQGFYNCPNCGKRNDLNGGSSTAVNKEEMTTRFKLTKTDADYVVCLNRGHEHFNTYKYCQKCGKRFVV